MWFTRKTKRVRVRRVSKKYMEHKEVARELVRARLEYFNLHYQFTFGRIAIKNSRSRWGSCSSKGNLNFNYRLALISPHLLDYVVVHELCHRSEFNHSDKFWALVAQTIPDYKEKRTELRKIRL